MNQRIQTIAKPNRLQKRIWLSIIGLVMGSIWAPVGGNAAQAQTAPPPVSRGYSLLNRGLVNDAIAAFQSALRRYPQSQEARLGLATAYRRAGQDANAWNAYQQVLTQNPNSHLALTAVGLLGSYRSEWQAQGIAALTTLLSLTPDDQGARSQRALLLGYQGRFAEALADYEIVLRSNPTPETILGAAQIYTYSGDYQQGLALFNRYRASGATLPNTALTAYALALQETDNPAQAIAVLASRLQGMSTLDATAIQIRAALAIAYEKNQQPEAALVTLQPLQGNISARLPLARALSTIARQTQDTGRYEEAVNLYRQVLAQTPNPSIAFVMEVADVLSELPSSQAEALQLYQQLIEQQPNRQNLQVRRLILAKELGQISPAELQEQLQAVLQTMPTAVAEQRSLAQALIRLDPPDPALLPAYQNLLGTGVDAPFLNFRIAQMLLQTGDLDEARQALTAYSATPAGAQDLAPELLLAEIERQAGNLAESAQRYERAIARNPSKAVLENALRGLAGIRLAQGQPEAALSLYDQLLAQNPADSRAQLGRASLAYQTGSLSLTEAEATLNQWIETHAEFNPPPEFFDLVGNLPPSAERESLYKQLLAIAPDNIAINRRLVQVLAERYPDQARTLVNQLIASDPTNVNAYWVQGELAQTLGDLDLASQAYQTILAQQSDNADALSALAGVRFQQRRYPEATSLYTRVLALKPNDFETRRILAELSLVQDHPLTGLRQLQDLQAEQQGAGTPNSQPNSHLNNRVERVQVDLLRRRGFQPYWERY